MKKYFLRALSFLLAASVLPLSSACFHSGAALSEFSSDTVYLVEYSQANVTFTVRASGAPDSVALYNGSNYVEEMYDNGEERDAFAGDGIYTARVSITTQSAETIEFHAEYNGGKSSCAVLEVVPLPDEEEVESLERIFEDLSAVREEFGHSFEDQMFYAEQLIDSAHSRGEILSYTVEERAISFVHSTKTTGVFLPVSDDTLSFDDGSNAVIMTMEPFDDFDGREYTVNGVHFYGGGYTDLIAGTIVEAFPHFSAPESLDLDGREVTTDSFDDDLAANQILIWIGHGGYSDETGSFLVTGERIDRDRYKNNSIYHSRFLNNETVLVNGRVGITSKYIDKYVDDLTDSLIFLNACQSMLSPQLGNAFLEKGAAAVVGYTETVYTDYAVPMQYTILTMMTQTNPGTGECYSLGEAVEAAKAVYGDSDRGYGNDPYKGDAELMIMGGEKAENLYLGQAPKLPYLPEESKPSESEPSGDTNEAAHEAYLELVRTHGWIPYCISDLSEIPPEEYDEYWLGEYCLFDINNDGIDELGVQAGQSMGDMSMTFFTYQGEKVIFIGSMKTGPVSAFDRSDKVGLVLCEMRGGLGTATYLEYTGGKIVKTRAEEFEYINYEDVDTSSFGNPVNFCGVHDLSGL